MQLGADMPETQFQSAELVEQDSRISTSKSGENKLSGIIGPLAPSESLKRQGSMDFASDVSAEIKAVSIDTAGVAEAQPAVQELTPRSSGHVTHRDSGRMVVIPAGGYGKSSPKRTPTPSSHQRIGSASSNRSVALDVTARTPSGKSLPSPTRELDRMAIESRAPPRFICPVSGRVMRDPIILATGTTCDRAAMERRLAKGNNRCPVTNRNLRAPISMTPNNELRAVITKWAIKNATWMLDETGQFLQSNEIKREELQGNDPQYVSTPGSGSPTRTPSRIDMGKSKWTYTNGSKVRPGSVNLNATPGTLESGVVPWYTSRGIASPRTGRRSGGRSRSSGSRSPRRRRTGSKREKYEWFSIGFLCLMSVVYLAMFLLSLSFSDWKMAAMGENPWYGATTEALVESGALTLPLMKGPSNEWWRLFSSIFLPAGLIDLALSITLVWMYGMYSRTALPFPQGSVACTYFISGMLGSLATANLNSAYVSCGAMSGVCGLLGCMFINQCLNWPKRKLWNIQEWYLVFLILVCFVGGLITLGLLPLSSVWFASFGFISGLLFSMALITIPRVGKDQPKSGTWRAWQITSSLILFGLFVAGAVGCALPSTVGASVSFFRDASCLTFSAPGLSCLEYGFLPNGCGLQWDTKDGGAVVLACPGENGGQIQYQGMQNLTFSAIRNETEIQDACSTYCSFEKPISVIAVPPTEEIRSPPMAGEPIAPSIAVYSPILGDAPPPELVISNTVTPPETESLPIIAPKPSSSADLPSAAIPETVGIAAGPAESSFGLSPEMPKSTPPPLSPQLDQVNMLPLLPSQSGSAGAAFSIQSTKN